MSQHMRILHLVQRYWPAPGGAETHIQELSWRLAAEGHHVTVATTDALDFELFWNRRKRRLDEPVAYHQGVRILRFAVRHLPGVPLSYSAWRRLLWLLSAARPVPTAWLLALSRFTPWVPDLWQWLRSTDETYDLVAGMTICFEPLLEAGQQFAKSRGIPFVVYPLTHLGAGTRPGRDALGRFYTMRHQVRTVLQGDALIAQTPTEAAFYQELGMPAERTDTIGVGINVADLQGGVGSRFRARHGVHDPIVFCISTMSYDKGITHIIDALRQLWRRGCKAHLVLAGTVLDPIARHVAGLAPEERERLLLLGRISEEEKRDLLSAGDVYAMPSRTDSYGIAYLEAWAYGKPVIGARTWGIGDVISESQDGLLVPFGDTEALANAIQHLLDHPDEAAAMGHRGRDKVLSQCTWNQRYVRVRALYQRLVEG